MTPLRSLLCEPLRRWCAAVGFCLWLGAPAQAGTFTVLDTLYTPPGFPEGPFLGTVCIPDSPNGRGVVLAHGMGSGREALRFWCDSLAAHGYVAMTIDYCDVDQVCGLYPAPVRAFKAAVQFLRRNAARFGMTSGLVAGFGQSQGSSLWGQAITSDGDHAFLGIDPAVDDHVDAVALMCGLYDMQHDLAGLDGALRSYFSSDSTLRATRGDPIVNTARVTTPVLLFHGTSDGTVPYVQSVRFNDSLLARGKGSRVVLFPGARHVFDRAAGAISPTGLVVLDSTLAFFERAMGAGTVSVEPGLVTGARCELSPPWPQPVRGSTTLPYSLPFATRVRLEVFDLQGHRVTTLVDDTRPAGAHQEVWVPRGVPSGVYFCKLSAASEVAIRKLVIVR